MLLNRWFLWYIRLVKVWEFLFCCFVVWIVLLGFVRMRLIFWIFKMLNFCLESVMFVEVYVFGWLNLNLKLCWCVLRSLEILIGSLVFKILEMFSINVLKLVLCVFGLIFVLRFWRNFLGCMFFFIKFVVCSVVMM